MVEKEPTKGLMGDLKEGSTLIRSLAEKLADVSKSMKILTCYECIETPTMKDTNGLWERNGPLEFMVSESSACLYSANEKRIPMQANHSMIAKLSDKIGSEYHTIKDHLIEYAAKAPDAIRRRLLKQECVMALSEAYTLAEFVYALVCMIKKDDVEGKNFKRHMSDELLFLEAFGGFLVDSELGEMLNEATLSDKYPQRIRDILQKLKSAFSSFAGLAMKYHERYRDVAQRDTADSLHSPEGEDLGYRTTAFNDELLQDPALSDSLVAEDSLDAILQKCKVSTRSLRETFSFVTLCSIRFETSEDLRLFQERREVRETDLAPIVKRQHLVRAVDERELEPLQGHLTMLQVQPMKTDLQVMQFYERGYSDAQVVIVEFRKYNADLLRETQKSESQLEAPEGDDYLDKVKTMTRKLAGLLHNSSFGTQDATDVTKPSRSLSYLPCLGFLEQQDRFRFAFVFKIPRELSVSAVTELDSLSSYIENFKLHHEALKMPPLEQRFSLAYEFCRAVLNLHACGWVHKSIRSTNIILIPRAAAAARQPIIETGEKHIPYLKGFEISRPGQGRSSGKHDFDPQRNLYRHPDRQGVPTEIFQKEHDLYAAGVVLLEIGMWKTLPTVFKRDIDSARQGDSFPEPKVVKERLMTMARTLVSQNMGTHYAQAVQKCINGFGVKYDDDDKTRLGLAFQEEILDLLETGLNL